MPRNTNVFLLQVNAGNPSPFPPSSPPNNNKFSNILNALTNLHKDVYGFQVRMPISSLARVQASSRAVWGVPCLMQKAGGMSEQIEGRRSMLLIGQ